MEKESLLKRIAETGYNVGFGAKKHFATYDIVEKTPGFVGFLSMSVGVFALFIDALSSKILSALLIVLGIIVLYINFYDSSRDQYADKGKALTAIFNELKNLYFKVKSSNASSFEIESRELATLEDRYLKNSISKQILVSDWFAHYKFFWQHQIDWIVEQKKFSFWRDKIPLSLTIVVVLVLLATAICVGRELLISKP